MLQAHQWQKFSHRLPRRAIQTKLRYLPQSYSMLRQRIKGLGCRTTGGGQLHERMGGGGILLQSAWSFVFKITRLKLVKHKRPSKLVYSKTPYLYVEKSIFIPSDLHVNENQNFLSVFECPAGG
jgi:hypothetical protein